MAYAQLPWNACVITTAHEQAHYKDLKNALLYATQVNWIAHEAMYIREVSHRRPDVPDRTVTGMSYLEVVGTLEPFEMYSAFWRELRASGLDGQVQEYVSILRPSSNTVTPFIDLSLEDDQEVERKISRALAQSHLLVDSRLKLSEEIEQWNSYQAVSHLFQAVSDLLLPDLSELPLPALADMRDRLSDTLDPMRAEMLRFTESLRVLLADKAITGRLLAAEARNLIATQVEPVVREANHRTSEMANSKFRKLFSGAAKAFGFAGAAFVDPKMIVKAVQQTLETGALAFADSECESTQPRASAEFVLHARTFAQSR